jgi:hypothetical protein
LFRELRFRDSENSRQFLDIFGGGLGLAVEERCDCDFGASELRCDVFEGEGFLGFGIEECFGGSREAADEGALWIETVSLVERWEMKQLSAGFCGCGVMEG